MGAVWFAGRELGRIIGGEDLTLQVKTTTRLCAVAYLSSVLLILLVGLLNPYGLGAPVVAVLIAAAGALSPLLWFPE